MKPSKVKPEAAPDVPNYALHVLGHKQRRYRIGQFLGGAIVIFSFLGHTITRLLEIPWSPGKPLSVGLILFGILVSVYFSWKERKAVVDFYRDHL